MTLRNSRDLYLAIGALNQNAAQASLPNADALEAFLRALHHLSAAHRQQDTVSLDELFAMLTEAYAARPPDTLDPTPLPTDHPGFTTWRATLAQQVRDLREMAEAGTLDDPHRYFGLTAPSGAPWYNFTPADFLECAIAGALGGWEDGDEGRAYVPGNVALLTEDGIVSVEPASLPTDHMDLDTLDWEDLVELLVCGQTYE